MSRTPSKPRQNRGLAFLVAIGSVFLMGATNEPIRMGNAPLYAVGVVTPDVLETARQYERILGVVPQDFGEPAVVEPDGRTATVKMHVVLFPNFYVKLQQPTTDNGPWAAHLRSYGKSIENAQFHVTDAQAVRAGFEQKGGRWVLGSAEDHWVYVDFKETLGTTLEPVNMRMKKPITVAPGAALPLGAMPVTHVGFIVTDARKAAEAYGDVFGIPVPAVQEERIEFSPGSKWSTAAHLRVARWRQGEIGVELIESVGGPTPWSEYLAKQKGNTAYSVAFDVGDRMDEVLRDLQAKGGKLIYEKPGGARAYLDFTDTLGLFIEISGTSKSASAH